MLGSEAILQLPVLFKWVAIIVFFLSYLVQKFTWIFEEATDFLVIQGKETAQLCLNHRLFIAAGHLVVNQRRWWRGIRHMPVPKQKGQKACVRVRQNLWEINTASVVHTLSVPDIRSCSTSHLRHSEGAFPAQAAMPPPSGVPSKNAQASIMDKYVSFLPGSTQREKHRWGRHWGLVCKSQPRKQWTEGSASSASGS